MLSVVFFAYAITRPMLWNLTRSMSKSDIKYTVNNEEKIIPAKCILIFNFISIMLIIKCTKEAYMFQKKEA